jgi:Domain of unknown function (DUF4148)
LSSTIFHFQELHMKRITLLKQSFLATVLLSATFAAFATSGGASGLGRNPNIYAPSLTSSTLHSQQTVTTDNAAPGSVVLETGANAPFNENGSANSGKTRAQVRAELLDAERAGLVPAHRNDYPPSTETVARNQVRFQQVEQAWRSSDQLTASR